MNRRGSSVAEALVAAALAGVALAGLASAAAVATASLALARDTALGLALAGERLEALRAGPRDTGDDVVRGPAGTTFVRTWTASDGRGLPASLAVRVDWGTHAVRLESGALP